MLKKIDHIGIAVKDLDEARKYYEEVLGLECHGEETVAEQKVRTCFYEIGEVHIELLEPTSEDSPVAKFIAKNGPGVHHLAYAVDDTQAALSAIEEKGVKLIDMTPRTGAGNKDIGFLHPKFTGSVLTELCAPKK